MKRNVGSLDKTIRIIAGLLIIIIGIRYESLWGLVGLIPLITGLVNWCPVYNIFGISTNAPRKQKTQL